MPSVGMAVAAAGMAGGGGGTVAGAGRERRLAWRRLGWRRDRIRHSRRRSDRQLLLRLPVLVRLWVPVRLLWRRGCSVLRLRGRGLTQPAARGAPASRG